MRKLATKRQYRTSLGLRNAQIRISPDRTDRNVCSPSARVRASDSEEKSESKQLLVAKNILTSSPSQGGLAISGERTPSRVNNFFPPAIRIDSSPFPDDSRHVSSAARPLAPPYLGTRTPLSSSRPLSSRLRYKVRRLRTSLLLSRISIPTRLPGSADGLSACSG